MTSARPLLRFLSCLCLLAGLAIVPVACSDSGGGGGENNTGNNGNGDNNGGDNTGNNGNGNNGNNGNGGNNGGNNGMPPGCTADSDCPSGQVCNLGAQSCTDGDFCQADFNCPNFARCQGDDASCYCFEAGAENAVCRLHQPQCGPCNDDSQCARDFSCTAVGATTFCLQSCEFTGCDPGFSCDNTSLNCVPASGECAAIEVCESSDDCQPGFYCRQTTGACVPRCSTDRRTGVSTGCAANQACHFSGECGAPCANDGDCTRFGANLICETANGRCNIDGCVDSSDCPAENYCDTATNDCIPGCEVEEDCRSGRVCENGQCRDQPCDERGGADLACDLGEFCCGENAEIDAMTGGCANARTNGCYDARADYCMTCTGMMEGECGGPTFGAEHFCVELQDSEMMPIGMFCGVGCRDALDCPRGFQCSEFDNMGTIVKNCTAQLCARPAP